MIENIDITGVHMQVNDDLRKYTIKKIGKLDQYVGKHARKSMRVEVKLKESKIKTKKERTCEVIMHLPGDKITTRETTLNMFAAVDIVEAKLKNQLKKYKEKHGTEHFHRKILRKFYRTKP